MKISRTETWINYIVLGFFAIVTITPLVGVVLTALTPQNEADGGLAIPSRLAFENFAKAWDQGHFATYMQSSVIVTASVVLLTTILASFAGYGLARLPFPGSNVVFVVILFGLMLPAEAYIIRSTTIFGVWASRTRISA